MAKIDTNKIEGYAEMSAEDKLKALEGYEFEEQKPQQNESVDHLKSLLSKANSEAADYKNKWKSTLDEQEKARIEREEADRKKDEKIAEYEARDKVRSFENKYLSMGYDADLAKSTAEALVKGDMDTVFANQSVFTDGKVKAADIARLNAMPTPTKGNVPDPKAAEDRELDSLRKYAGLR